MRSTTKTIILLVCMTLIYSLENKVQKSKNSLKSSPTEVISSPALLQSKLKEKVQEKVAQVVKPTAVQTAPVTTTTAPATTTTTAPTPAPAAPATANANANSSVTQASIDPNEKFLITRNIKCDNKNCQAPYGVCADASTCRCLNGYANFVEAGKTFPGSYCNYEQKKQLVAFLLEMFVGMGVGHFYSGRVLFGVFKLLVLLGPLVLGILMCCSSIVKSSDTSSLMGLVVMIGSCACICTAVVWQLVDLIMFGINNYKDGNAVPLAHW
jgi:hypothetical protein